MELRRRIGSAAASLAVATVVWLVVHNLDRSPARLTVSLNYEVPPDVVVAEGAVREVEVRALATKPKLRTLQPSELDIRVPFGGKIGSQPVVLLPDDVKAPFGVVVEQVQPGRFTVVYDKKLVRSVPVRADVTGQPADGFEVARDEITVVPSRVTVAGPSSAFTESTHVTTTPLDVSGRTATVGPVRAALVPPSGGFTPVGATDAVVTVPIRPVLFRRTFEVPVTVVRGPHRTSDPNPRAIRVTIEGPEQDVRDLDAGDVAVVLDVRDLDPQPEDHRPEPTVSIAPGACPGCRVAGLSQARINIRVRNARPASGGAPSSPDGRRSNR